VPNGEGVLADLRDRLAAWEAGAFGDALDAHRDGVTGWYLDGLRGLLREELSRERAVLLAALTLSRRHRPQHRLESWRPQRCRLHAFVARAVRGSARQPLQAGAFTASLLGPAELGDAVHRHRCIACGNLFPNGRDRCPICGWQAS
jgi:hypothetical protein